MPKRISLVAIIVVALVLSVTTYAFAASNTMPASTNAGDGSVAISGYTVAGVTYGLAADASKIQTVTFTLTPATVTTVKVQLDGGTWYPCTVTTGTAVCTIGAGVTVAAANSLHVVAAQ
jgi:hypothetical protein